MTRGRIRSVVVAAKLAQIREALDGITAIPLASEEEFLAHPLAAPAAESYLRRTLEALLDLGRHILAKGFGVAAAEYKAVPQELRKQGVIAAADAERFVKMAGYRNRMVHFYDEIGAGELFRILTENLRDVEEIAELLRDWLDEHQDLVDGRLDDVEDD